MEASPVDPRDTDWESREATYRVYFWANVHGDAFSPTSFEWRITSASDVYEVISWAEQQRDGRSYELFVEHVDRGETPTGWIDSPGLIRLGGDNPTDGTTKTIQLTSST